MKGATGRVFRIALAATAMVGLALTSASVPASASSSSGATWRTISQGYDNPRDIVVGADGRLFVAEAGKGGPKCVGGDEGNICPGMTGGISVASKTGPGHHRIVSGLASLSDTGGVAATGPDGMSRNADGSIFTVITSCPQQVRGLPAGAFPSSLVDSVASQAGQVLKVEGPDRVSEKGGVGGFDWTWSQGHTHLVPGQFPDCDPYGILTEGQTHWVVDAASNTLDRVLPNGNVSVQAFIPNPRVSDSVPTCLDRGPDGALYIGELTGGGNGPGASVVWRVVPGQKPTVWASGLTAVTGCGFVNGQFYASEFSTLGFESFQPFTGAVVRVAPHSTKPVVVAKGLSFTNGFASEGNSIWVSNWSVSPAHPPAGSGLQPGSIVRIDL
ncbi:MAG: ScyD/ScyE family protein [Acidimicrobiia bacterium]|nr:ScyD/ScyE family protein [Acidimicrobiia bacterium]